MKYYFVYIILSSSKNLHYIGHTSNLADRFIRHNNNRSKFTKNKGPWNLVASYKCESKSEAYRLELKLKAIKNPVKAGEYLKNLAQSTPTKSEGLRGSSKGIPPACR